MSVPELSHVSCNNTKDDHSRDEELVSLGTRNEVADTRITVRSGLDTLVSLVIPVRDTRLHLLERALTSATTQSHRNLEILVVDDGSTSTTADFLDDYARRDPRLHVVHQTNQGVAAARNRAIADARGVFIGFLDSDDYISEDFVASALGVQRRTGADIVFGQMAVITLGSEVRWRALRSTDQDVILLKGTQLEVARAGALSAALSHYEDAPAETLTNVVGALFSMDVVRGVCFPNGVKHGEDRVFNSVALSHADIVAVARQTWYTYDRTDESGVTHNFCASRIPELLPTIDAFARAGGLSSYPPPEREAACVKSGAALGILNYVKLAVMSCARQRGLSGAPMLDEMLQAVRSQNAIAELPRIRSTDRVIAALAAHGSARPLVAVGKIRLAQAGISRGLRRASRALGAQAGQGRVALPH